MKSWTWESCSKLRDYVLILLVGVSFPFRVFPYIKDIFCVSLRHFSINVSRLNHLLEFFLGM